MKKVLSPLGQFLTVQNLWISFLDSLHRQGNLTRFHFSVHPDTSDSSRMKYVNFSHVMAQITYLSYIFSCYGSNNIIPSIFDDNTDFSGGSSIL